VVLQARQAFYRAANELLDLEYLQLR